MNPSPELVQQVAQELKEIQNAPPIIYGATIPRCDFCGAIVSSHEDLKHIETHDGMNHRRKGPCCHGNAHRIEE